MSLSSKSKVYFSKSNASDPILAAKVRKRLDALDVEIVEYSGYGSYDPAPMKACATLLILPPPRTFDLEREWLFNVGRGQYEQVKHFMEDHDIADILIVTGYRENNVLIEQVGIQVDPLEDIRIIDNDWKTKYAVLEGEACDCDLTEFFNLNKPEIMEPKPEPDFNISFSANTFGPATPLEIIPPDSFDSGDLWGYPITNAYDYQMKDTCGNYIPKPKVLVPKTYNTSKVLPILACAYLIGLA